jgi:hypothetical protein
VSGIGEDPLLAQVGPSLGKGLDACEELILVNARDCELQASRVVCGVSAHQHPVHRGNTLAVVLCFVERCMCCVSEVNRAMTHSVFTFGFAHVEETRLYLRVLNR